MSGSTPEIPDELHILAGEYVLGVLDTTEMRAVRRRATSDAALGAAIAGWERRLAPLAETLPPAAPPAALWSRLERSIAEAPADTFEDSRVSPLRPRQDAPTPRVPEPPPRPAPTLPRPGGEVAPLVPRLRESPPPRGRAVWPWQLATVGALAMAAAIAAIAFVPSVALRVGVKPARPQVAALLPADEKTPAFLAEAQPDGSIVLTALAPVPVPAGHDLELWMLRPGATVPASLGVLPAEGRRITLAGLPPDGTQLMVSLEPPGGSPTGLPTGAVLYKGALTQLSL